MIIPASAKRSEARISISKSVGVKKGAGRSARGSRRRQTTTEKNRSRVLFPLLAEMHAMDGRTHVSLRNTTSTFRRTVSRKAHQKAAAHLAHSIPNSLVSSRLHLAACRTVRSRRLVIHTRLTSHNTSRSPIHEASPRSPIHSRSRASRNLESHFSPVTLLIRSPLYLGTEKANWESVTGNNRIANWRSLDMRVTCAHHLERETKSFHRIYTYKLFSAIVAKPRLRLGLLCQTQINSDAEASIRGISRLALVRIVWSGRALHLTTARRAGFL